MSLVAGLVVGLGIVIVTAIGMTAFAIYLANRDARELERRQQVKLILPDSGRF